MSLAEFERRFLARAQRADAELQDVDGNTVLPSAISSVSEMFAYYQQLRRWNERINLTALPLAGYPEQTIDRLLIEPLVAARFVPHSPLRWFDLGSGGGSPAVPLKIARPAANLTMVEARERKVAFLREIVRTVPLASTEVRHARIETLPSSLYRTVDLVTTRAIRQDHSLVEVIEQLLGREGLWIAIGHKPTQSINLRIKMVLEVAGSTEIAVCERT